MDSESIDKAIFVLHDGGGTPTTRRRIPPSRRKVVGRVLVEKKAQIGVGAGNVVHRFGHFLVDEGGIQPERVKGKAGVWMFGIKEVHVRTGGRRCDRPGGSDGAIGRHDVLPMVVVVLVHHRVVRDTVGGFASLGSDRIGTLLLLVVVVVPVLHALGTVRGCLRE